MPSPSIFDHLGFGFVEYEESRDAEEALHALDRYRLLGRELEVEFARGDRKSKTSFFPSSSVE